MSDDPIRASEINEYCYCARAWWLRRQGVAPDNPDLLKNGARAHTEHNTRTHAAQRAMAAGIMLLMAAAAALIMLWLFQ